MDWFLVTCGGAALYAAGRWVQAAIQRRKGRGLFSQGTHRRGIPLKAVVANCEAKWFLQELQQAMSGDHTAMVRVSHMLLVGYGTRQDEAAAAGWMRKAWALQNFKEPADPYLQYDMLDLRSSDIPVLNDPHAASSEPIAAAAPGQRAEALQVAATAAVRPVRAAAALRLRTRRSRSSSATGAQPPAAAASAAAGQVVGLQHSPRGQTGGGSSSGSTSSGRGAVAVKARPRGSGGASDTTSTQSPHHRQEQAQQQEEPEHKQPQQQGCLQLQQQEHQQQAVAQQLPSPLLLPPGAAAWQAAAAGPPVCSPVQQCAAVVVQLQHLHSQQQQQPFVVQDSDIGQSLHASCTSNDSSINMLPAR